MLVRQFLILQSYKADPFLRVDGADDLVMTHTRYQSLGVGLPYSPAEGILTNTPDGKFILKMDRPYKTVKLRTAVQASKILSRTNDFEFTGDKKELVEKIREALYFSKIMSYAQGFAQLRVASKEFDWDLPFGEIAKIWRAGCIIRARFLQKITNKKE